ncbi:MAG: hypothetical protein R2780_14605 [Crocinitomicaceae bacterium]|nr:hypothetical protein [Crocinitomicaceae bacterium]
MKNWTKKQIFITSIGYIGLIIFGYGFIINQDKLKVSSEKIKDLESLVESEKGRYNVLEYDFVEMATELDSLYYVIDADGSILKERTN